MARPQIVFFGNEKLATGLPNHEPIIRKSLEKAGFKIEKHLTGSLSELGQHEAKLAVLAAYGRIIPQAVLDQFPMGIINVHPSLLPLYRGPTPIEQAILDGAHKTGVSIMRLTAGMDEGPIYKQKTVQLTGRESKAELTRQLQNLGAELLLEVLPGIANRTLKPRNQPHPTRATYSHKISVGDGILDFTKSAERLEKEVRAYAEWPKSRTNLAGIDVIITKASVTNNNGKPGSVSVNDKQLLINCAENALLIEELRPAGKNSMSAEAFLAGYSKLL